METMEKVCPSCGRKCPPIAGFCTGCGTNIQEVAPTPTVAAATLNQVQDIAGTVLNSAKEITKGVPILNFIPLVATLLGALFTFATDFIRFEDTYDRETFTFGELFEFFAEDVDTLIFGIILILPLIINLALSLAGAITLIFKKTVGKILSIIGQSLTTLYAIALFVIMLIIGAAEGFAIIPKFGLIALLIFAIVGIVFSALAKTNKKDKTQAMPNQPYNTPYNYNGYNQF